MDELRRIQSDFLQKAVAQYTAETGKLVQLSSKVLTSGMAKTPG